MFSSSHYSINSSPIHQLGIVQVLFVPASLFVSFCVTPTSSFFKFLVGVFVSKHFLFRQRNSTQLLTFSALAYNLSTHIHCSLQCFDFKMSSRFQGLTTTSSFLVITLTNLVAAKKHLILIHF